MLLSGARILLECLQREGTDTIFGYPGGAVLDIYDELSRTSLRHVLVRHEQAAVHAADGYARASGKVGVCLVTSGPGATNTVTGIATAYCDSIPLVVLTGQVPTTLIGNDAFQEVDTVGITRPCTKHNYLVKDIKDLAGIIRQAYYIARSGRPGPVVVDLPKDVMQAVTEFHWPQDVRMRSYNPNCKPNLGQIRRAADLIAAANRPLFITGGGLILSNASEELTWLARTLKIPVTSSFMGLGGYPGDDPLWLGMLGMHGSVTANRAVVNTDLIVAVGTRFADRITGKISAFAPNAKIIHIDIDPTSIRKNIQVDVPVVADCKQALAALREIFTARVEEKDWERQHAEWLASLRAISNESALPLQGDANDIKPQEVIRTLYELSGRDTVVATDVGQHQMWAGQYFTYTRPRTLLSSGGLGTMGFGLPAAIGAQFAMPDSLVLAIVGDGSIQMNIQELATAVQHRLPLKIIILNNCYLGMIRQWQELFYGRNYSSCTLDQPDFVKLAEAYGAEGYRISTKEELLPTLKKALASPNLALIDVRVAREENVYPMVPSGKALDEMLLV